MDIPPVLHRRDFDSRQKLQTVRSRGFGRRRYPSHRVVVGNTYRANADGSSPLDQCSRIECAIGGGRVQMEVNQNSTAQGRDRKLSDPGTATVYALARGIRLAVRRRATALD